MHLLYIESVDSLAQELKKGVFPHGVTGIIRPDTL